MKKYLSILLAVVLAFALDGCASNVEKAPAESAAADVNAKSEGVMTYAEYTAADLDSQVTIEAYVQAKQSWWENQATVYTQDADGAYFLYNMACSEEDYAKLEKGTKIKATGYKSEWSGEVEITDATFEIEEGSYVADAKDVTDLLGQDSLIDYQNQFVGFKGLTVEAADDTGAAYTFTVESYLCGADTDVYKAVKNLKVGDTVDLEGFLYWYEGVNPHITSVTVK